MYQKITVLLTIISFVVTPAYSARILVVVPSPSYSHQIVFQPLWKELSLRGHQVVVLTTDPIKDSSLTNLTEIDWNHSYSFWNSINIVDASEKNIFRLLEDIMDTSTKLLDYQLGHPEVQNLIENKTEHFDIVLVEAHVPAMFAFPQRFKCPYIIISSLDAPNYLHEYVGNPVNPIVYPDFMSPYVGEMNFFERIITVYSTLFMKCYGILRLIPLHQQFIHKYFGPDYPSIEDILQEMSMIFINTNPIFHQNRPLVPAVVSIGGAGVHIKNSKPLPKDLQNHANNATVGFIYFSLGTNIKSKHLTEDTRRVIMETFAELPYTVFWKFEFENLKGKPDNVFISKWFPQQDVFKHPNIKLFITQGGLQSMEEAVHNKIPMVVLPFFADQPYNAKLMVSKEIALSLDYKTLDKQTFKGAIFEVINNPKYRRNVERIAVLSQDQQTTGLERAIWWTEYVLRHKGAHHLRGPGLNMPFYQKYLLDIIGFSLIIVLAVILLLVGLIKLLIKIIKYFNNVKEKLE